MTVIFADLSGFTTLSERMDPEEVRALQDDFHHAIRDVVREFDGFLEKFVGDAALVIFGAPIAHEDDPERGLRAALALMERIDTLNERWQARVGQPLRLHIGVNTGPVVAGALGAAGDAAYAVTGDTVNTAARLQSAAGPGEILVGPQTHSLTRQLFTFEPVGEISMKGKSVPIFVYRLSNQGLASGLGPARGLASFGLSAPLIGRVKEMTQLKTVYARAIGGRAQIARIVGDAGSGKTRLVDESLGEFADEMEQSNATVHRTSCSALGRQGFGVLAQLVRNAFELDETDDFESARNKIRRGLVAASADGDVHHIVSSLGPILGLASQDGDPNTVPPEQLKRQIFVAARDMLETWLNAGPVIIVIEDLHWSDPASVEVLRYMVEHVSQQRVLLLVSHRPTWDAAALHTENTPQTIVRLSPLDETHCHALFDCYFGASTSTISDKVRSFVAARAGGNPFYLEELVRSLIEKKLIYREEGIWTSAHADAPVDIPMTIQGLLISRLDRLSDELRARIQEAAILGVVFRRNLLATLAGPEADVESGLAALCEAEIVERIDQPGMPYDRDGDPQFRFTHAIVQEVIYENLLMRRRTELHGLAGEALEKHCSGTPQRLEDADALARHFSRSADQTKGLKYLVAAGDWSRRSFAAENAASHFRIPLQLVERNGRNSALHCDILERLADTLGALGERDAALAYYRTLLEMVTAPDHAIVRARTLRKMAGLHWEAGERDTSFANLQAALGLVGEHESSTERGYLCQEMGRLAFRSGDNEKAIDWAGRALSAVDPAVTAAATAHGQPNGDAARIVAEAYNTIGVAKARLGEFTDAVADVERSLEIAEFNELHDVSCRGYTNLGVLYSTLDPRRAIDVCQRGLAVAIKIGDLAYQSLLYANLGVSYCTFTGRCEGEGVDAVRRAIELDRQLGLVDHLPVSLIALGQIYQCHGQPRMAIEFYQEALELAVDSNEPQLLFPCYDGLATVHLDIDDLTSAEKYMEQAQAVCERAGLDPDSLVVMPFLC